MMRINKCAMVFALVVVLGLMMSAAAMAGNLASGTLYDGGESGLTSGVITQVPYQSVDAAWTIPTISSGGLVLGSGFGGYAGTYNAVCIDINDWLTGTGSGNLWQGNLYAGYTGPPAIPYTGTVVSAAAWNQVSFLANSVAGPSWSTWTPAQQSGFQLAVWDLMSAGSFTIAPGSLANLNLTSGGIGNVSVGQWETYYIGIGASAPASGAWDNAEWVQYVPGDTSVGQDFLLETGAPDIIPPPPPNVPELPVAALCPLGLALAGLLKRRFSV